MKDKLGIVAVVELVGSSLSLEKVEALLTEVVEGNDRIRQEAIEQQLLVHCAVRSTSQFNDVRVILRSAYWSLLTQVDERRITKTHFMESALPIFRHFCSGEGRSFTQEDKVFFDFLKEKYPHPDVP